MWVFKSPLFATPAEFIPSFLFTALLPFFVFVKSLLGERTLPLCPVQGLDAKFLMALYEKSYDLAIINIVPACHREQRGSLWLALDECTASGWPFLVCCGITHTTKTMVLLPLDAVLGPRLCSSKDKIRSVLTWRPMARSCGQYVCLRNAQHWHWKSIMSLLRSCNYHFC